LGSTDYLNIIGVDRLFKYRFGFQTFNFVDLLRSLRDAVGWEFRT